MSTTPDAALVANLEAAAKAGGVASADSVRSAIRQREGRVVELDLGPIASLLGDYNEAWIEPLEHVEQLTLQGTTLRTLDLAGYRRLSRLHVGAATRELMVRVSPCERLTSIEKLPYDTDGAQATTRVFCRTSQLTREAAGAMERAGQTPSGTHSLLFELVDSDAFLGLDRVRQVGEAELDWLMDEPKADLATILASYWALNPWFWAEFADDSTLPASQRHPFRRVRELERRVAEGFYTNRKHAFDIADDAWKYVEREPTPDVAYARSIPSCMYTVQTDG